MWGILDRERSVAIMEAFYDNFQFQQIPSSPRAIVEPTPSAAWIYQHAGCINYNSVHAVELSCNESICAVFRLLQISGEIVAVTFEKSVHTIMVEELIHLTDFDWSVSVVPIYEFGLLAASDFSWGIFANPAERSVCVFGEPLVQAITASPLPCMTRLIRINNLPVDLNGKDNQ